MTKNNKFVYSIPDERYYYIHYTQMSPDHFLIYGYIKDQLMYFAGHPKTWFRSYRSSYEIEKDLEHLKNNTFPSNKNIEIVYDSYIDGCDLVYTYR